MSAGGAERKAGESGPFHESRFQTLDLTRALFLVKVENNLLGGKSQTSTALHYLPPHHGPSSGGATCAV